MERETAFWAYIIIANIWLAVIPTSKERALFTAGSWLVFGLVLLVLGFYKKGF